MNYSTTLKNARLTAVLTQLATGSGSAQLVIGTAGMATNLCSIPLPNPVGTVSSGVLTFTAPGGGGTAATGAGTAAAAYITDRNGVQQILNMSVGTSGTDIIIDNPSIVVGQLVNVTSASITHA